MSAVSWYINDHVGTPNAPAVAPPKLSDSTLAKVARLFPAEVATIYTGADAFARAFTSDTFRIVATGIVALVAFAVIPQAFKVVRGVVWRKKKGRNQILLGMLSFLVWAYATGGFSMATKLYDPLVAGIVVTLFVGLVALFVNPPTTVNGGPDA